MSQSASPTSSQPTTTHSDLIALHSSRSNIVNRLADRAVIWALDAAQKIAEKKRLSVPFDESFKKNFSCRIRTSVEESLKVVSDPNLIQVEKEEKNLWSDGFQPETYTVEFRRVLDIVVPIVRRSPEQIDQELNKAEAIQKALNYENDQFRQIGF